MIVGLGVAHAHGMDLNHHLVRPHIREFDLG
jgi:hypothetical protein